MMIVPIGGADMPTVISLLNSYAGLSAAAMGFVLNSKLLIIAGALDGSSGFILSVIMAKAMNRSFTNVLFGAFGQVQPSATTAEEARPVHAATAEEAAEILAAANTVVVVPGYGMAVAQAQHKVRELVDALTKRGVDVKFGIHPVAGRMPGQMNVLLAEADIPYDRLFDLDAINPELAQTDVVLIIGANDVTNPAARTDASSPIYGMPILDVDKARTVMVIKRSMSPGFAGIDNELYYLDKTLMLFGDAKTFVGDIVKALAGGHTWHQVTLGEQRCEMRAAWPFASNVVIVTTHCLMANRKNSRVPGKKDDEAEGVDQSPIGTRLARRSWPLVQLLWKADSAALAIVLRQRPALRPPLCEIACGKGARRDRCVPATVRACRVRRSRRRSGRR